MKSASKIIFLFIFGTFLCTNNFSQKPELVLQTGHNKSDPVERLAFSPDGRLLASISNYSFKIWDTATTRELRSFNLSGFNVQALEFSADGMGLLVANDGRAAFYNVVTGKKIWEKSELINPVAFSPDGKLFSAGNKSGLTIYDSKNGNEIKNIEFAEIEKFREIAFSNDARLIALGGDDGSLKIIDVVNGEILFDLQPKMKSRVEHVVFSPDGKKLLATAEEQIGIFDSSGGKLLQNIMNKVEPSASFPDPVRPVKGVAFNPDGRSFIVANGSFSKFSVWDTSSGKVSYYFDLDPRNGQAGAFAAFSPDGKFLAGSAEGTVFLWDLQSRKIAKAFESRTLKVHHVAFNPNNKSLVSVSEFATNNFGIFGNDGQGRNVNIWSKQGKDFQFLKGNDAFGSMNAVFTKNGESLLTIERLKEKEFVYSTGIKSWNTKTAASSQKFPVKLADWSNYLLSYDAETAAIINTDFGKIELFNIKTGNALGELPDVSGGLSSFNFSKDGKLFVAAGREPDNKNIKIWQMQNRQILRTINLSDNANSLTFSADNSLIAGNVGDDLKIFRTTDGAEIITIEKTDCRNSDVLFQFKIAFSPDNGQIACTAENYDGAGSFYISLYDVKNGKLLRRFEGHRQKINALDFSPDGKFLISGGDDSQTKIWDVQSGKELANLITFDETDWLVTTPEGFFDGTPRVWKNLFWRFNNNIFDTGEVELYFNDFFYPNLLQNVLEGNSPNAPTGGELEKKDRRQPKIEIASTQEGRTAKITVEITDNDAAKKQPAHTATSGARDLRLFRNGSLVKVWRGDAFDFGKNDGCEQIAGKIRRVRCTANVPIIAGENDFTAYAFNFDNVKSADGEVSVKGADSLKRGGTLYVLAIGVNKYTNPDYNLNFAVPDVEEMSQAVKNQQAKLEQDGNLKQYERTEIVTLTDENASKDNILLALRRFSETAAVSENKNGNLKTELEKIKTAQPEDALVIYYAGHGMSSGGRFYILPHDFTGSGDDEILKKQAISDLELNDILEKVDAGRLLMVIDACQSGQALGGQNEGRAPMNSKGLAQLAYDKGMLILTAAQSYQAALEAAQIGGKTVKHGLLTYALLEALSDEKADADDNRQLWEREWFDYAVLEVPQMQLEMMKTRSGIRVNDKDKKDTKPEDRTLQTPRVFYRRESAANPFLVAKQ